MGFLDLSGSVVTAARAPPWPVVPA
jgi:hypothetical protein